MKIVHLIDYFQPRVGYQEYFLAKYQQKFGNDVLVITSDRYYPFPSYQNIYSKILGRRINLPGKNTEEGIKVLRLPCIYEYRKSAQIILKGVFSALRDFKPDIVHCHNIFSPISLEIALYKRYLGFRLIFDSHVADFNTNINRSLLGRFYDFLFLRPFVIPQVKASADGIFAIAEPEKEFLYRNFGFSENDIEIINLGVDTELFRQSSAQRNLWRKNLGLAKIDVALIFSGKIIPSKNLGILFEAIKKTGNASIRLILVGGGNEDYIEELKLTVVKLGISVSWFGFVLNSELVNYYRASDIAVWPGDPSISFLEAMATGLPLIIPKWKGTTYLEKSGGVLYFDRSDSHSLSKQLEKLVKKEELRSKMGGNASDYVKKSLSWEIITRKVLNFYTKSRFYKKN